MSFLSNLLFGKPPPAPDYVGAAKQQGTDNLEASKVNAAMNRLDETNPYGSIDYSSTANPNTPGGFDYSRAISLSPEQQKLYDLESGNQIASQEVASGLQKGIADSVSQPFSLGQYGQAQTVGGGPDPLGVHGPQAQNLGNAASYAGGARAVGDSLFQRQLALRQPQMARASEGLDLQLRNQGLQPGSQAYDRAVEDLRTQHGQELNDLAGRATEAQGAEQSRLAGLDLGLTGQNFNQQNTGFQNQLSQISQALAQRLSSAGFNNQTRGQNIQEGLLERQQPLSEYNAFRTGNTPTLPQFQPYSMTNTAPAPTYQGVKDTYGAQSNAYNQTQAGIQSLLNFGSKFVSPSDRRLKQNLVRVGTTARGHAWYTWDWITGGSSEGVVAQEVMRTAPHAVGMMATGFLGVDYSQV